MRWEDSMYCIKCGKQNRSDAKFCYGCGDAIASVVTSSSETSLQMQSKQFALKKIHFIIAACVVVVAVVVGLLIYNNTGSRALVGTWVREWETGSAILYFRRDGRGTARYLGQARAFTWETNGETLTIDSGRYTFRILGDTLLIVSQDNMGAPMNRGTWIRQ